MPTWTNWARTVHVDVATVERPRSVAELQEVVTRAARRSELIKPIGSGHSFTGVGATTGVQLQLDRFVGIERVDVDAGLATVRAGTPLHQLNEELWQVGLAMTNLGDIDAQTISGAISTGTHGTGAHYGGLATQVHALELVDADGRLVTCSAEENTELFAAARIGLGALGVIAFVTVRCQPAFALAASERPADLDETLGELDQLVTTNDHFEFYWFPHTRRVLSKRNNRVRPGTPLQPLGRVRGYVDDELLANTVFGALNKVTTRRPSLIPRANRVAARALSARDFVDRSYRVFTSHRAVRFREMEYAVPRAALPGVLAEIDRYLQRSGEHIGFPVEVRFAAADDVWLSTAYGRDTAYVAVHQYIERDYEPYFRAVEDIARAVDGRPHWGKLHFRDAASLRETYPHFDDFVALRDRLDPQRRFGNRYLRRVLGS